MYTHYWENETIYIINRDLQLMIDSKKVKTVVSLSMVTTDGAVSKYSAILIYK